MGTALTYYAKKSLSLFACDRDVRTKLSFLTTSGGNIADNGFLQASGLNDQDDTGHFSATVMTLLTVLSSI